MSYSESSGYSTAETVYGTHEESHQVMSEKVQSLAGSIYKEFERMIAKYDRDVVKTLMPLLVNVLECLDSSYQTNQEHDVELELLREDNEQLVTQYEREKAARKLSEQKLLEVEDSHEGERKELSGRLETADSIIRMLELKNKNAVDHASRLEERENELKKEYAKLHDRYTELFKTHMDYMERTKLLLNTSGDRSEMRGRLGLTPVGRSSGAVSFGFRSLETSVHVVDQSESMPGSPVSTSSSPPTIDSELAAARTVERAHQTDPVAQLSQATSPLNASMGKSQTTSEKRSGNTLYQELSFTEAEASVADDEAEGITGNWVHPGEYASSVNDNYFGMGKEVENLILENNELLATKNALNVVKDDLIVKVDELTGEQEILREEVSNLSTTRDALKERISSLEDEIRALKEAMSNNAGGENEDDADVPMAQRRRFTRVEMARVLMERNQYKERLIELQDAVRWTEMVRASRGDATIDKKKGIWKFFSNLFSTGESPQRPLSTPHLRAVAAPTTALRHSRTSGDFLEAQLSDQSTPRRHERADQFRQVRAHVRKEDGRTQAYGWSLPGRNQAKGPSPSASVSSSGVPVPVPVYCRPVAESVPRMTLLCAAGVTRAGGVTPDGGCMVGGSVFYGREEPDSTVSLAEEMGLAQSEHSAEVEQLSQQLRSTSVQANEKGLSSLVWIATARPKKAVVMVIDAQNPGEVIESFSVSDKHVLCIASVPGAVPDDYAEYEARVRAQDERDALQLQATPTASLDESADPAAPDANGTANDVGYIRYVSASLPGVGVKTEKSIIVTPPATPMAAQTSPGDGPADDAADPTAGSPPLNSTPVKGGAAFTEAAVDAALEEDISLFLRTDRTVERDMSSVMATMWLGTKSGTLYVHSAVANYTRCIVSVKLRDAILSIAACASRCVVALADGTVAIFARQADGQWCFAKHQLVTLGDSKCSVRCLSAVGNTVWCGFRNKVHVLEPRSGQLLHTLEAHPRQESQVRQMACARDGVWVSIKMDSTLRLYHAHTYQHLIDVDIEPYVSKMLGTGKLGFSLVRITALLASTGRLWIGTSNGVVISVPLTDCPPKDPPGQSLRARSSSPVPSAIPWCSMAHAQLSFHGHRDAVSFFVSVPATAAQSPRAGSPPAADDPPPVYVMSGGEGYIDFRTADSEMEDSVVVAEDGSPQPHGGPAERAARSHLIVWQVCPA